MQRYCAYVSTPTDAVTTFRLDPISVRALAHPLRSRLLGALRRHGPATATELADRLGTNTGATSYHLRRLEAVGLVVDTGAGEGRRRVWRAATEAHSWSPSDFAGDEDAETALDWLVRDYVRVFTEQFGRWLDVEHAWPASWRDAAGASDYLLVAAPEHLDAFKAELEELVARYRLVGEGDPDARGVSFYCALYPFALDDVPGEADTGDPDSP